MRNPFLEMLAVPEETPAPGTFWATVTDVNPVRVQRDGEPVLPVTPKTLDRLSVGDRVLCIWDRRQVIVLGRLSGLDANSVVIDGATYARSGSVACPSHTWSGDFPVYYTTVNAPVPYTPPAGWTFAWSIQQTSAFSFAQTANPLVSGGTQQVRLLQVANVGTTAITRLQWQLVKS